MRKDYVKIKDGFNLTVDDSDGRIKIRFTAIKSSGRETEVTMEVDNWFAEGIAIDFLKILKTRGERSTNRYFEFKKRFQ